MVGQPHHFPLAQNDAHRILHGLAGVFVDDVENLFKRFATGFLLPPTREQLGRRIEQFHAAFGVGGDDRIANASKNDAVTLLACSLHRLGPIQRPIMVFLIPLPDDKRNRARQCGQCH